MGKIIKTTLNTKVIEITLPFSVSEHIDLGIHKTPEITLNIPGLPHFYTAEISDVIDVSPQLISITDSLILNKKTQTLIVDIDNVLLDNMDDVTFEILDIKEDINYYTI